MAKFSDQSLSRLKSCHPLLQQVFNEVVKKVDCSIIEGYRDQATQNKYFKEGSSKVQYPDGKHNKIPSLAVDVAPYPIDWKDTSRFYYFAGYVKGIAHNLKIPIRWGGDWDQDNDFKDQKFNDLVHFELLEKEIIMAEKNITSAIANAAKGKSKTVNYNALMTALIPVSAALGFPIPQEIVPAVFAIGNIIIRFFTSKHLGEK